MVYTSVALLELVLAVSISFRYRVTNATGLAILGQKYVDDFYAIFDVVSSTNYWKYGSMLLHYSKIGFFGVAFLTQVLSIFGIMTSINLMVWQYGIFVGVSLVNVLYIVLVGYA